VPPSHNLYLITPEPTHHHCTIGLALSISFPSMAKIKNQTTKCWNLILICAFTMSRNASQICAVLGMQYIFFQARTKLSSSLFWLHSLSRFRPPAVHISAVPYTSVRCTILCCVVTSPRGSFCSVSFPILPNPLLSPPVLTFLGVFSPPYHLQFL
jgi:hypothetical protein